MSDIAGELTSREAWHLLEQEPNAVLIDVRTQPEWSYVGVPDTTPLGKRVLRVEWQVYPGMQVNPGFLDRLAAEGLRADQPLLFMCRSGARSRSAALLATERGFTRCYNLSEGFEGPLDAEGHRGRISGWKQAGLPWRQQ